MVMWFNVEEEREFLLREGFVYTLRPKKRKREEREVLMYGGFGKKGMINVEFIGEIANDMWLLEYVEWSGFKDVEAWRRKAGKSRFLYKVKLLLFLDSRRQIGLKGGKTREKSTEKQFNSKKNASKFPNKSPISPEKTLIIPQSPIKILQMEVGE